MGGAAIKAETIVIGSAFGADGARCVRLLMAGEKGERMVADLSLTDAFHLAGDLNVRAQRDGETPSGLFSTLHLDGAAG